MIGRTIWVFGQPGNNTFSVGGRLCLSLLTSASEAYLWSPERHLDWQFLLTCPLRRIHPETAEEASGKQRKEGSAGWEVPARPSEVLRVPSEETCRCGGFHGCAALFASCSIQQPQTFLYCSNCFPLERIPRLLLFWSQVLSLALSLLRLIIAMVFFFIKMHAPMKGAGTKAAE